jgi:Cdc6-like AAA superfamily ATPase
MSSKMNTHQNTGILDWPTLIDYSPQQSDFISRRQEETGQWLLDPDEFQGWVNQSKQTLFCPGIPGAGKTIITSIVVEYLWAKYQDDGSVGIAYLYCNFRQQQEQKPVDLLASILNILKQLTQRRLSVPENVTSLYNRHKDKGTRPSFDEISQILQAVIADYSRTYIIIDALDECQVSDRGRRMLLSEFLNLQTKTSANFFATSRFIPEIMNMFEGGISLEIRASDEDVMRYLDGHMLRLPSCVPRGLALQEEIKTEIIKAVDGMYVPFNTTRLDKPGLTFAQVSSRTASSRFAH